MNILFYCFAKKYVIRSSIGFLSTHFRNLNVFILLLLSYSAKGQVTGVVKDYSTGEALIGASILLKGTTTGTLSNSNGSFELLSGAGDSLIISYTGYESIEVIVPLDLKLNILLKPGIGLNELIVVGYSSQSRRDISGSVAVVNVDDMKKIASSTITDQLQGQIAGVQIGSSGDPGAKAFVRIRGFSTINNNEPLYVIDGVPVINQTDMNFINPNDIQSIQVLKDASSSAVYGARAANGVILINTKKGKIGENKINVDITSGIQIPGKFLDLLSPSEQLIVDQGLFKGAGVPFTSTLYVKDGDKWKLPDYIIKGGGYIQGVSANDPRANESNYFLSTNSLADQSKNYLIEKANKEGTNWAKEVYKSAPYSNYQLSTSGGSTKARYFLSANYYDQHGTLIENEYKRYQVRVNNEFTIKNKIRLGNQINYSYHKTIAGVGGPIFGGINPYFTLGIFPVQDIKGNYGGTYGLKGGSNLVAMQERKKLNDQRDLSNVFGNLYAEMDLLPGLTFKSLFGFDYRNGLIKNYVETNYEESIQAQGGNDYTEFQQSELNWNQFNTLNYSKTFFGFLNIQSLSGIEASTNHYEVRSARVRNFQFGNDPQFRTLSNGSNPLAEGSLGEHYKFSMFQSLNAKINDKYLFTGIVRRDGSSRFINNRYSTFYGLSAAWRVSDEDFFSTIRKNSINDLKFRIGYGETGNNEAGDYPGYSTYSNIITFPFGGSLYTGAYSISGNYANSIKGYDQSNTGNPDLKWESNSIFNVGVDATLFNHMDIILEGYRRITRGMIFGVDQPSTAGKVGSIQTNIGSMKNTGFDLNLKYRGQALSKKINYSLGLTLSHYKNEVLNLDNNSNTFIQSGGSDSGPLTRTDVGHPISQFYGYLTDGLWKNEEEIKRVLFTDVGLAKPGRFKFVDINKDGKIDDADNTIIGSPHPDIIYGLQFNANSKNFDLSIFLNGCLGNEIINAVKFSTYGIYKFSRFHHDVFTQSGSTLPVLDYTDVYSFHKSDFFVEDGSYLRVKNIQIGYTFPSDLMSRVGISKLKIYLQAQNIITWTKYSGADPDVTIADFENGRSLGRDYTLGVDYGRYPTMKSVMFGINLEF